MTPQAPPIHSFDAIEAGSRIRLGKTALEQDCPSHLKFRNRQSEPCRHYCQRHVATIRNADLPNSLIAPIGTIGKSQFTV